MDMKTDFFMASAAVLKDFNVDYFLSRGYNMEEDLELINQLILLIERGGLFPKTIL